MSLFDAFKKNHQEKLTSAPNAGKPLEASTIQVFITSAASGERRVMEGLLALHGKALLDAKDAVGCTALMRATEAQCVESVQWLLDKGANVDAQSEGGYTALVIAADNGFESCLKILLEQHADTELKTKEKGWTALMCAAAMNQSTCLKDLLKAGAQMDAVSSKGKTARMIAEWNGRADSVQVLQEWEITLAMREKEEQEKKKQQDIEHMRTGTVAAFHIKSGLRLKPKSHHQGRY